MTMTTWMALAAIGLTLVAAGLTRPYWTPATKQLLRKLAGFRRHEIAIDGHQLVYHCCGKPSSPPLVLLHGFAGDCDNWLFYVRHFRRDFHVIVPDLPGFGETGALPQRSYSLNAQLARLAAFFDSIGLHRFHLAGNSLGGYFAAAYAADHPERVASLALFNAAGVDMPHRSPFYSAALEGRNLLLVRQAGDFDHVLKLVYHRPPWIPGWFKRDLTKQRIEVAAEQDQIFQEIFEQRLWLDTRLPRISMPTLVLWGDDDRVLDISSVSLFRQGIAHAEVAILPACGHVPMLEKPNETARLHRDFMDRAWRPLLPSDPPSAISAQSNAFGR
ncbi:alpha/beta fold hydrolase [Chitinimonas lacunae]|uniref:Alpha/beta fold hydrolase n=1 Tax=Chitinimonas lacunae TaxID=1963018 RepID=A0ABV8MU58_9NEIS